MPVGVSTPLVGWRSNRPYLPETLVDYCDYVFDLSDEGEQAEAWYYVKSTGITVGGKRRKPTVGRRMRMGLLWPDLGLELAASSFGSRRARAASRIVRFLVNDFSLALASELGVGDRTILSTVRKCCLL